MKLKHKMLECADFDTKCNNWVLPQIAWKLTPLPELPRQIKGELLHVRER